MYNDNIENKVMANINFGRISSWKIRFYYFVEWSNWACEYKRCKFSAVYPPTLTLQQIYIAG